MAAFMLAQQWQQCQRNNGKDPGAMGALGDNTSLSTAGHQCNKGNKCQHCAGKDANTTRVMMPA
jgi:hypothetical protein